MRVMMIAAVLAGASPALAEPKQTIAVLGVEAMDHGLEGSADRLTAAIRELAGKRNARYVSKGTAKLMRETQIKSDCKIMEPACAQAVGTTLGVDFVLAGELTKRGTHQVLVVALFDVRRKQRVRSTRETGGESIDAKKWGRMIYDRLIAETAGELLITANAQAGEILVDGAPAATLFEGRATIAGLAPGSHQLVIRAPGFKPFEVDVTIDGTTKQTLLLEPNR